MRTNDPTGEQAETAWVEANEPDNPRCSVDGCEKPAVVELLQDSTQNRGYRCERCLHYDGEQKGWW